jgi:hypothetical protein
MAISVPIGTEHYIWLKEISDKLGLSLKKTMEHLVSFYYSEMIKDSVEEMREEAMDHSPKRAHDIEMTAPSLNYQQSPATVQVHQQKNLFANPTIKNETPKPTKVISPPSKPASPNSPPWVNYTSSLGETHEPPHKPDTFTVPLYSPNTQGCPSCGASKSADAKFCHNCGHSV